MRDKSVIKLSGMSFHLITATETGNGDVQWWLRRDFDGAEFAYQGKKLPRNVGALSRRDYGVNKEIPDAFSTWSRLKGGPVF